MQQLMGNDTASRWKFQKVSACLSVFHMIKNEFQVKRMSPKQNKDIRFIVYVFRVLCWTRMYFYLLN